MLLLVLRRMLSSRWMVACLLLGTIMAAALVSCIPLYTDGILQRMLTKDLENYQNDSGVFPGKYTLKASLYYNYSPEDRVKVLRYFDSMMAGHMVKDMDLPVLSGSARFFMGNLYTLAEGASQEDAQFTQVCSISGIKDHISITNGRMYHGKSEDGAYEAILTQKALQAMNMLLGSEYTVLDPTQKNKPVFKVKVVGVFTMKDNEDLFWQNGLGDLDKVLVTDQGLFSKELLASNGPLLTELQWQYALDYHKLSIDAISGIADQYDQQFKWANKYKAELDMPAIKIIKDYTQRAAQLKTMLWVLTVPILIMLTFFIFMVSQLIIKNDENGIAVLKSRGASKLQIFLSYLAESSFIGAIAFAAGPPLGMLICRILGSSNGFLEFVQRTALPLKFNTQTYLYSLAAVVLMIGTMLIPAVSASRTTIVRYKQSMSRAGKAPLWKRYFLDVVVLGMSAYGLYRYHQQEAVLSATGIQATELHIDPLLFLTSTLFVLGAGLLFLRVYPYLVRLIYWLGRKIWSPVAYVSLIQVGRSRGQEQFLMLFIILAISTGLFNANAARTINRNIEDKIHYSVGADVTLMAEWRDNRPPPRMGPPSPEDLLKTPDPIRYIEPDFNQFSSLKGAGLATRVLQNDKAMLQSPTAWVSNVRVMGIIPSEFAKVAWFRNDLLPYHWYYYLNMMTEAPKAVLVSTNLRDKYKLKEGDTVDISWGDQSYIEGTIYAFIDYWPTYNPNPPSKGQDAPGLVVANFSYMWNKLATQPYEVWIKKLPGATDKDINDDIEAKKIPLKEIDYANQQIIKMKNDPMLQGINGSLTLGFVAAMLISLLGFLIYWIISIQGRVLQFGIFRAMGISMPKVIGMLACEQLLVSGAAILTGLLVGGETCDTFIPLLQIVYSSAEQVPPFRIMEDAGDYIKIYAVLASMLVLGFLALWRLISKIRIDQAVKLGED